MKSFFLFVFFYVFLVCEIQAQKDHKSYIQQITGTNLNFEMKAIPGGVFKMGSEKGEADEKPVHSVSVEPFWMGAVEVTWDIYEPFLYKDFESANSVGSISPKVDAVTRPTKPYLDMTFGMGKQGHPALAMTHYNAIQYCKWLYARTGIFYRLPTEAEWEFASRAGSDSQYFFGDDAGDLGKYAWFESNSENKTHAVGQKAANPFGLYDIYGNIAEWTYDQYVEDFYAQTKDLVKDPVAQPTQLYSHVIRGGSYSDKPEDLRSGARSASDPSWKQLDPQIPKSNWWFPEAPFVGFRLVRPLNPPSQADIDKYYNAAPIADY